MRMQGEETRRNRQWTDEDNERLKMLISGGVSAVRAAAIFNQSIASIRRRANMLGAPFPTIREQRRKLSSGANLNVGHHVDGTVKTR